MASRSCRACESCGVARGGDLGDRVDQGFQLRQAAPAAGAGPEGSPRACSAQRAAGRARGLSRRPGARGGRERGGGRAGAGMGGGSPRGAAAGRSERGCGARHCKSGRRRRRRGAAALQRSAAGDRRRRPRGAGVCRGNAGPGGIGGSGRWAGRHQRPVHQPSGRDLTALRRGLTDCFPPRGRARTRSGPARARTSSTPTSSRFFSSKALPSPRRSARPRRRRSWARFAT